MDVPFADRGYAFKNGIKVSNAYTSKNATHLMHKGFQKRGLDFIVYVLISRVLCVCIARKCTVLFYFLLHFELHIVKVQYSGYTSRKKIT